MDVKKEFGAVVKSKRLALGLSQEALAERADLHRTYVTDIERGTRNLTLESIYKLACALGVTISDIFRSIGGPEAERAVSSPAVAVNNHSVDLLLAEGSAKDVELTIEAFKRAKLTNRLHIVRSGVEALDFLFCRGDYRGRIAEFPPSAVLLDMNLPIIDGLEVLRRIKAEERTRDLKVVMLSASRRDDGRVNEAMRLGAVGCMAKPVDFRNFSQMTPKLDFTWTLFQPSTGAGTISQPAPRPSS
jgi:two-component system, response regulator